MVTNKLSAKKSAGPPAPPHPKKAPQKPVKSYIGTYVMLAAFILGLIVVAVLIYGYYNYMHNKALAEFKGGKVTRNEFTTALRLQAGKYDPLVWKDDEQAQNIKKEILNDIVRANILLVEAEKLDIKVDEGEFKTDIDSYKSGYTDQTFDQMLKLKGLDYKSWVETKRKKYLIQKLIQQEVIDKIKNSPAEIHAYYNGHKNEFSHAEQVRARHILVNKWEEAEKIAEELEAGGNFAAIAKEKSISPERWKGGDLGYFSKGTHPEIFDKACFNVPVGEVSQVVKSEYGYHIFKVLDKRGPVHESPEDAANFIDTQLKKQKSSDAFENWVQPIYGTADIRVNDDLLQKIEVKIDEEIEE